MFPLEGDGFGFGFGLMWNENGGGGEGGGGDLLVNENRIMKYTTNTGQNTGTLKTENHVHAKLIAMALVAECQNLNSGNRRINGRNSSSFLLGKLLRPSSRPSSCVSEGSNLG